MTALSMPASLRFGLLCALWFGVMFLAALTMNDFRRDSMDPSWQFASVGFAWGLLFCATWVLISPGSWWLRLIVGSTSLLASAKLVMDQTGSGFNRTMLNLGMIAGSVFIGITLSKATLWNADQQEKPRNQFTIFGLLVLTTAVALWTALAVKLPMIELSLPERVFLIAITVLVGTLTAKLELSSLRWWQRIGLLPSLAGVWLFSAWVLLREKCSFDWKGFGIFLAIYLLTIFLTTNLGKRDYPFPQ